ncbi:MAG: cobalt ECF transporter T component CbiQ [Thermoleophilia bacterium]
MADDRSTPAWMTEAGTGGCQCLAVGRSRRESAIQRTIMGMSRAIRKSVFSERVASRPGLLQETDPRIKTVGLLGLLVAASFLRHWYIILALYGLALALAAASRISLRFFIKRVWLFIPVFAGIIALPSLFNTFRPGDPLWTLWDYGREITMGPWSLGTSLAITHQGLKGAVVLVLRVATSVSLAVLLALTTRWTDLLKALRVFLVPRVFVLILSMTYRYIFLILGLATDMFTARTSRQVGTSSPREDRHFIASSMAALLGKSHALSEDVYAAMISRGYAGEPMILHDFRSRPNDWLWLAAVVMITAALLGGDRLIG